MKMKKVSKETWGSHVPLHMALIKNYNITGVLEAGAGLFSTKMFIKNIKYVTSVETDKEWIAYLKTNLDLSKNQSIELFDLKDSTIKRGTNRKFIDKNVINRAVDFYRSKKSVNHNMLFIDCIAGLRLDLLENLYRDFDIITFHDYQETTKRKGITNCYGGVEFFPDKNYKMFVDNSFTVSTGLLIKNDLILNLDEFKKTLDDEVKLYSPSFVSNLAQITT